MMAKNLIVCYAILQRPEDDFANAGWHRDLIAALDEFVAGHYVGESDIVTDPKRAEASLQQHTADAFELSAGSMIPTGSFSGSSARAEPVADNRSSVEGARSRLD
jgi:hypothetical protein